MSDLTWTSEPPKVPGWYWVRQRCERDLPWEPARPAYFTAMRSEGPCDYWQYAGPIPTPKEGDHEI